MTNIEEAQILFNKGVNAFNNDDYISAKEYLEKSIVLNPKDERAYHNLAVIYKNHLNDINLARAYYEKAIEFSPQDEKQYYNYAVFLAENNDFVNAKKNYVKAIDLKSDYVEAHINYAIILQHFQEYQTSKEHFEKAIEFNTKYVEAYYNYANLLDLHFQDYERAKKYYEKAIAIKPEFAGSYNNIAILLMQRFNEIERAREYFLKAIELNPKDVQSYYNLSYLLKEHYKDYKKADEYYRKAREIDPFAVKRISKITLKDYNQFKKGTIIDFTYPLGHPKAGEPLDKVCLIGQSGTGKSSILEIIKSYISENYSNTPNISDETVLVRHKTFEHHTKTLLINFPPYSVENIKKLDSDEILNYEFKTVDRILDFEKTDPKEHWYPIQKEITDYQKQVIQFSAELGNKIKHIKDINIIKKEIDDYQEKIKQWEIKNPNPLVKLDNFLEPLFSKFFLKIKLEPDNPEEIKFIPIESISFDENQKELRTDINTRFLSTGTQQILSRTVPLFALKPKDTIILIDEPENSLYPNIQKEFIDFITLESWNENEKSCQFFFATHSPTIASSFDPWEIVELQFNKSGKVEQKLYFEGERRVENYKINPKYLRWDDILIEIFNTKFEGDQERNLKLQELSILERDIEAGVYKGEERQEMIKKYRKIASLLNWKIENQ